MQIDQLKRDPFTELVGLQWDRIDPSLVLAHLDVAERHHQPMGIVHGGVYTALVEVAASVGANVVSPDGPPYVGISNMCDFVRPHSSGRLNVTARPLSAEDHRQLWVVEITRDRDGELVAVGRVQLQALE